MHLDETVASVYEIVIGKSSRDWAARAGNVAWLPRIS
jgi:hypothetical protein